MKGFRKDKEQKQINLLLDRSDFNSHIWLILLAKLQQTAFSISLEISQDSHQLPLQLKRWEVRWPGLH